MEAVIEAPAYYLLLFGVLTAGCGRPAPFHHWLYHVV